MKKKMYEKPTTKVYELKHRTMLLAGSNPAPTGASVDDYQDGEFSWEEQ